PSGHIYIYDSHAGGSGISYLLYQRLEEAFKRAHYLVSNCRCEDGCPRCIYSPYCGNNNKILSRRKAEYVLKEVILKKEAIAVIQERYGKPIV
ncbi:MAG: DEAD/DEAH box helicase, partial [Thermoprotei archaeon]